MCSSDLQLAGPAVGPVNSLSNMSVGRGSVATLGPVLSNPTGTTIQWLKDGVLQDGQSAASITLNPFQYTDSGAYQAVLTKAGCTTITRPVYLDTPSLSKLFGWGSNQDLQLGGGSQPTSPRTEVPVPLTSPGATTIENGVVAAAAGQSYSMLLKRDGTLWGMGANAAGQLGDGTTTLRASPVKVATDEIGRAHV